MIELLAVQATTTLALAAVVIKLRRELWPLIATAGPVDAGFWIRSASSLVVAGPQFEAAKTVIKIRWAFTEELFLRRRIRIYNVAMSDHSYYKDWKAWMNGDHRYRCISEKPRGLARLYSKAIYVLCFDMEDEKDRLFWNVIEIGRRMRKRWI